MCSVPYGHVDVRLTGRGIGRPDAAYPMYAAVITEDSVRYAICGSKKPKPCSLPAMTSLSRKSPNNAASPIIITSSQYSAGRPAARQAPGGSGNLRDKTGKKAYARKTLKQTICRPDKAEAVCVMPSVRRLIVLSAEKRAGASGAFPGLHLSFFVLP